MWTSCKGAREGGEGVCLSSVDVSNKLKCLHSRHKVGVVMNIINISCPNSCPTRVVLASLLPIRPHQYQVTSICKHDQRRTHLHNIPLHEYSVVT